MNARDRPIHEISRNASNFISLIRMSDLIQLLARRRFSSANHEVALELRSLIPVLVLNKQLSVAVAMLGRESILRSDDNNF